MFKNKRGWLRVVEAFASILLVVSVLLVVAQQGYFSGERNAVKIIESENSVLREIQLNKTMRNLILGVEIGPDGKGDVPVEVIKKLDEEKEDFMTCEYRICKLDVICEMEDYIERDVYSRSVAITVNNTFFSPRQLKMFCWSGSPECGDRYCSRPEENETTCPKDCEVCKANCSWYGYECGNHSYCGEIHNCGFCNGTQVCNKDGKCVDGKAILDVVFEHTDVYDWVNPETGGSGQRVNWSIEIAETTGINFYIDEFKECWSIKPDNWNRNCKTSSPDEPILVSKNDTWIYGQAAFTDDEGNIYNLTYSGYDENNHSISTDTYVIEFP